jgi:hypothetical protein
VNAERALVLLVQLTRGPIRADVLDAGDTRLVLQLVGKGWAETGRSKGAAVFKATKSGRAKVTQIRTKVRTAVKRTTKAVAA